MYLTLENISSLNSIISELNSIDDEEQKEKFLNDHLEDTALFLETIRKINKKNIPKKSGKTKERKVEEVLTGQYQEEEIYKIIGQKDNVEIMKEYSLSDLKKMYASVYNRQPASSYTKERIISTLRNRMHKMRRAEAFAALAEERNKKKTKNF